MFGDRLLRAIHSIPPGRTRSVSEIAAAAGRPWAARAAGRVIAGLRTTAAPWHRVVRADGGLTCRDAQWLRLAREGARPAKDEPIDVWLTRAGAALVANLSTRVYCRPSCAGAKSADPARIEPLADAREAALRAFHPCPRCAPPRSRVRPPDPVAPGPRRCRCTRARSLSVEDQLGRCGHATLPGFVPADLCTRLAREARSPAALRREVLLEGHGMGRGVYGYVGEGPARRWIDRLRADLYEALLPHARLWLQRLGRRADLPDALDAFQRRCAAAGQRLGASTLLRYEAGGWNAPHRDLYGPVIFPFQALVVLSATPFRGGAFAIVECREEDDDLWHVIRPARGDALVFPSEARPIPRTGGFRAVEVRHALLPIRSGARAALGLVLHGAAR